MHSSCAVQTAGLTRGLKALDEKHADLGQHAVLADVGVLLEHAPHLRADVVVVLGGLAVLLQLVQQDVHL